MTTVAPEHGPSPVSIETGKLVVSQPSKLKELTMLLESFENLDARVSEKTGEDRSGDLGSGGQASRTGTKTPGQTARDKAIADLPESAVMQRKLKSHIQKEVNDLARLANRASHSSAPGSAFRINEFYARIRRLNALLAELLESSIEVIRRLFIRVFIDHQEII